MVHQPLPPRGRTLAGRPQDSPFQKTHTCHSQIARAHARWEKSSQKFSLNFIPGVGQSDMETLERVWAGHNGLGNLTKTQGPGGRQDVLDDHFRFWNWLKYVGMGKTLISRYKAALAERNRQVEGHQGLTNSLDSGIVEKWELMCIAWEECDYPKKGKNPYATSGTCAYTFLSLLSM